MKKWDFGELGKNYDHAKIERWVREADSVDGIKDLEVRIAKAEDLLDGDIFPLHHPSGFALICCLLEAYITTQQYKKGEAIIRFSQKCGLDERRPPFSLLAVLIHGENKNVKEALYHLSNLRYFGKYDAVKELRTHPLMKALWKNKEFLDLTGHKRPQAFLVDSLKEAISMWKKDEYDNLKDALLEAQELALSVPASKRALKKKAEAHLSVVTKRVKEACKEDDEIKKYIGDLI